MMVIFLKLVKQIARYDNKDNKMINHNIFFLKNRKIITTNISTSNIISIGICSKKTKSKLLYFFLLKITMAFLNYMQMHNCKTSYNIHSIIYETLLLSPIKSHFSLAIKQVFRRYTLYINNINFKNYYLVDLCSDEIVSLKKKGVKVSTRMFASSEPIKEDNIIETVKEDIMIEETDNSNHYSYGCDSTGKSFHYSAGC